MVTNNIILVLASLGLFQGILLFIYLVSLKSGNRKLNLYLALVLLGLTIRIGKSVIGYYTPLEAWQKNIGISGIFIVGPYLWLYGISLFHKNTTISKWHYFHLFPFALFISLLAGIPANGEFGTFWNYGLVAFHLGIYLILSWMVLIKIDLNASPKKYKWFRNILIGVTLVWVYYLGNLLNIKLYYIWGPIFYSFLIYAFTYLFLNRNNFEIEKYSSSGLNRNNSLTLFNKIQRLFKNENLFLEPAITIKTVSEKLSENPREISQAINENARQNFNEFVNYYRISKAKALMDDSENRDKKIATIAYDSGFGTVTAFNVAFKKSTGITPSVYRRKNI